MSSDISGVTNPLNPTCDLLVIAELYGVETRVLIQAAKRNGKRFPSDVMYQLTKKELMRLRSQIVISKQEGRGGRRYTPYAFTEQGIAMLSSVLNSDRAIEANLQIMRTFVALRRWILSNEGLRHKMRSLRKSMMDSFKLYLQP